MTSAEKHDKKARKKISMVYAAKQWGNKHMKKDNPGEQFCISLEEAEDDIGRSGSESLKKIWEKIQLEQDVDAMEYIGLAYLYGNSGLPASFEKGIGFLHLAAQGGCTTAQHYIADCYAYGIGVEQDADTACEYYRLAIQDTDAALRQTARSQLERLKHD